MRPSAGRGYVLATSIISTIWTSPDAGTTLLPALINVSAQRIEPTSFADTLGAGTRRPYPGSSNKLATETELSDFLEKVERRAFKQAAFAVRDDHTALDIVQDAMFKLADRYRDRPIAELPPLFQRILQNTIRDFYRRQKVRTTWTTLFSSFRPRDQGDEYDFLETFEVDSGRKDGPQQQLERTQLANIIEEGLKRLPARQRQAFILRYWEELDVAETASAMGCSQGSVKTHCSRATHSIAAFLKNRGIEL